MANTLRVHSLAKELGVTSKEVIEKCCAEGIELKNHMAALSLGLAESIREWFSAGEDITSIEVAEKIDATKIRKAAERRAKQAKVAEQKVPAARATATEAVLPAEKAEPPAKDTGGAPATLTPAAALETVTVPTSLETIDTVTEQRPPAAEAEVSLPAAKEDGFEADEGATAPPKPVPPPPPLKPVVPAGPKVVPKPAELRGPRLVRIEAPDAVRPVRPRPPVPPPGVGAGGAPAPPSAPRRGRGPGDKEEEGGGRSRSPRRRPRGADVVERIRDWEWRDQDLLERRERLASATGHGLKERRAAEQRRRAVAASAGPAARKSPIELTPPIVLKGFCAAVGAPFTVISRKLLDQTGKLWTINQSLDADTAELLALDLGVAVTVSRPKTALEELQERLKSRERGDLRPRPPVVAMLGHVDHGKTSLLDAIRRTQVVKGEAGGITQHIGAYRLERSGWRVTFLDTPGHEAFTAMRARGANLTDVVVLVIAADDGIMPQTVEALNHARAAEVPIVVALNKIDLPGVDSDRIYGQLAEHGLTPSEWGGETDVIRTSAVTGEGIEDLLAHLSTLSELMDLRADATAPAQGTVIEAQMREGQGVVAQVLLHEGTLRPGQIIVCGAGAGRVRNLRDDRGRIVKEVGPGQPTEVSGLDTLPETGDRLYQLDDLKLAKDIAAGTQQRRREASLEGLPKPRTLEDLLAAREDSQVPELNVIIRADAQGSADVLKQSLGTFPSEKAQLRILHAAVGAVTEADVHLARASNALIIGFHVVPEERARQLADQLGVEIRQYRVIYEILSDMHKALAGLLEPVQRAEIRGAADVRQIFNISRLGTVAGCLVSSGTMSRSHKVRLVRDGRVVLEKGTMHSLKRFKEDARMVRAGLECGIKLDGFDDLKPGDVIETYEIVEELQEL